jgi:hypothetical protein
MSFLINLLQKLYGSHVTMQTNIPTVLGGVRVTRSLVACVCVVDRCLSFCTFSFVHCILLQFTDSDYIFGIFKLFLYFCRIKLVSLLI